METVMFQQVDKVGRCNVEEEVFEVEQNGKEEGSLQAAPLQLGWQLICNNEWVKLLNSQSSEQIHAMY